MSYEAQYWAASRKDDPPLWAKIGMVVDRRNLSDCWHVEAVVSRWCGLWRVRSSGDSAAAATAQSAKDVAAFAAREGFAEGCYDLAMGRPKVAGMSHD